MQKECSRMKYPRKVQEHGQGEQRDKASQSRSELVPSLDATDSNVEDSRTEGKHDSSGWVRHEGSGEEECRQEEPALSLPPE